MLGDGSRALARVRRVIGALEAASAPLDPAMVGRAVRLTTALWGELFAAETGTGCPTALPHRMDALAAFGPCPGAGRDPAGYRAWHMAQGQLFLHYAPVAGQLLGPGSPPDGRAASLLVGDALLLLRDHAAGLGRDAGRYDGVVAPATPFAHLVQRTAQPCSGRSSDVNLGAVALALAVESGMRDCLGLPDGARLSMWRLFRALAEAAGHVRLTVDLPLLVAVYNWAGRHRSAGRRGYGWLNYFAADLLHPLFVPPPPLAFGLAASAAALARLRAAAMGVEMLARPDAEASSRPTLRRPDAPVAA